MKTEGTKTATIAVLAFALGLALAGNARAQQQARPTQRVQDGGPTQPIQHAGHAGHSQDDQHPSHDRHDPRMQPGNHAKEAPHDATSHSSHATALPREPIPPVTDADRAAAFPALDHAAMQHASSVNLFLLAERLETWDAEPGRGQAWDATAWIGGDVHRLWLRTEGERIRDRTTSSRLEAAYGRSISPWWDLLAGVRHDFRADSRTWAALGVQGMAPYKFEMAATVYLADSGRVQLEAEVEYELLLTQRLILQPLLEASAAFGTAPGDEAGNGLDRVEAGLRLRYEIDRRFAPYVGLVHERRFGDTARLHRIAGAAPRDTRIVAGLRLWF